MWGSHGAAVPFSLEMEWRGRDMEGTRILVQTFPGPLGVFLAPECLSPAWTWIIIRKIFCKASSPPQESMF
jgi:hypothetical protein